MFFFETQCTVIYIDIQNKAAKRQNANYNYYLDALGIKKSQPKKNQIKHRKQIMHYKWPNFYKIRANTLNTFCIKQKKEFLCHF